MEFKVPPRAQQPDEVEARLRGPSEPAPIAPEQRRRELVADLIAETGLLPADRLALLRAQTGAGSFSEALLQTGLAAPDGVGRMLAARYRLPFIERVAVEADMDEDVEMVELEADDSVSDVPIVRLVNSIILQAAEDGASDVHFEPQEDSLVVRFRIDGVLNEMQRIPRRLAPAVTTR